LPHGAGLSLQPSASCGRISGAAGSGEGFEPHDYLRYVRGAGTNPDCIYAFGMFLGVNEYLEFSVLSGRKAK